MLKNIGHAKSAAWQRMVEQQRFNQRANPDAVDVMQEPAMDAVHEATAAYVRAKKFHSVGDRDQKLLALIEQQKASAPAQEHSLASTIACARHLSPHAVLDMLHRQLDIIAGAIDGQAADKQTDIAAFSRIGLLWAVAFERSEILSPADLAVLQHVYSTLRTPCSDSTLWGMAVTELWGLCHAPVSDGMRSFARSMSGTWAARMLAGVPEDLAYSDYTSAYAMTHLLRAAPMDWMPQASWWPWRGWNVDDATLQGMQALMASPRKTAQTAELVALLGPAESAGFATLCDEKHGAALRVELVRAAQQAGARDLSQWQLCEAVLTEHPDAAGIALLQAAAQHLNADNRELLRDILALPESCAPDAMLHAWSAFCGVVHDSQPQALAPLAQALRPWLHFLPAAVPDDDYPWEEQPDGWRSVHAFASVARGMRELLGAPDPSSLVQLLVAWDPPCDQLEVLESIRLTLAQGAVGHTWLTEAAHRLGPMATSAPPAGLLQLLQAVRDANSPLAFAMCNIATCREARALLTRVFPKLPPDALALVNVEDGDAVEMLRPIVTCLQALPSSLGDDRALFDAWWVQHSKNLYARLGAAVEGWVEQKDWLTLGEHITLLRELVRCSHGSLGGSADAILAWNPDLTRLRRLHALQQRAMPHVKDNPRAQQWLATFTQQDTPHTADNDGGDRNSMRDAAAVLCDVASDNSKLQLALTMLGHVSGTWTAQHSAMLRALTQRGTAEQRRALSMALQQHDSVAFVTDVSAALAALWPSYGPVDRQVLSCVRDLVHARLIVCERAGSMAQLSLDCAKDLRVFEADDASLPMAVRSLIAWQPDATRRLRLHEVKHALHAESFDLLEVLCRLSGPATSFILTDGIKEQQFTPSALHGSLRHFIAACVKGTEKLPFQATRLRVGACEVAIDATDATPWVTQFLALTDAVAATLGCDNPPEQWAGWLRRGLSSVLGTDHSTLRSQLVMALLDGSSLSHACINDIATLLQGLDTSDITELRALAVRRRKAGNASVRWDLGALVAKHAGAGENLREALTRMAAVLGFTAPQDAPLMLTCPIGGALFVRPVLARDGYAYEEAALQGLDPRVSSMDGRAMAAGVVQDKLLRRLADAWSEGRHTSLSTLLRAEARCCVTGETLRDPVTLADGETYERVFAEAWVKKAQSSPLCGEPLRDQVVRSHRTLQALQHVVSLADDHDDHDDQQNAASAHESNPEAWSKRAHEQLRQDFAELLAAADHLKMLGANLPKGALRDNIERLAAIPAARVFAAEATVSGVSLVGENSLEIRWRLASMTPLQRIALGLAGVDDVLVRLNFRAAGDVPACVLSWAGKTQGVSTAARFLATQATTPVPWVPSKGAEALAGFQLTRHLHREVARLYRQPDAQRTFIDQLHKSVLTRLGDLASSCIACDSALSGQRIRPDTCDKPACTSIFQTADINVRLQEIRQDPDTADLFISLVYFAAQTNSTEFLRGRPVTQLRDVMHIIERLPPVSQLQRSVDLQAALNAVDPRAVPLLAWAFRSMRGFFVKVPQAQQIVGTGTKYQFVLRHHSAKREAEFEALRRSEPAHRKHVGFHGSSAGRWHSILREGLQNYSGTQFQAHGAAMGSGVYLGQQAATAMGYVASAASVRAWSNSIFRTPPFCIAMCEVAGHAGGSVMVVPEARRVMVRMLFVYEQTPANPVIDGPATLRALNTLK